MIKCRKCSASVAPSAPHCPQCGIQIPNGEELRGRQLGRAIGFGLFCVLGIAFAVEAESGEARFAGVLFAFFLGGGSLYSALLAYNKEHEDE